MANTTVTLVRYGKTPNGWKRGRVVFGKNGRIKPEVMLVKNAEVPCPQGHYELCQYEGKAPKYKNVGESPADAMLALQKAESHIKLTIAAREAGITLQDDVKAGRNGKTLISWRDEFLKEKQLEQHKSDDSYCSHKVAINEFLEFSGKKYPGQVTTTDLLGYAAYVEGTLKLSERTRWNRMGRLFSFLKFAGRDTTTILTKSQRRQLLSFTDTLPTIYEPAEIRAMIEHAGRPFNRMLILTAISTGFRDQELTFLSWNDVDFGLNTIRVTQKLEQGFSPKDCEERAVPMSTDLAGALKAWREINPHSRFVFETLSGKPDGKLLDVIKRVAKRASLNCGECAGCKAKDGFCRNYNLHKFRRTFITRVLRKTDLRTAMALAGHSNIQSTMRYLRPEEGEQVQQAVSAALADII